MAPTFLTVAPSLSLGTKYFVDSCSVQSTREALHYKEGIAECVAIFSFINSRKTKIPKHLIFHLHIGKCFKNIHKLLFQNFFT